VHLPLSWKECSGSTCYEELGQITLDANWRWTHKTGDYTNCYTGNQWDPSFCPNDQTCAQNCALDGVDENTWHGTYGVNAQGDALQLGFVTQGPYSKNVGSRNYLMNGSDYQMFKLVNREFTFDVDVSNMPCGLNGALYFSQMVADGGLSEYSGNNAGAKYGTGYCDAQCPRDIKFIDGEANSEGWSSSSSDPNAGTGKYGSCCMEFDVWEANMMSQAFTAHPCSSDQATRCDSTQGTDCGVDDDRYKAECDKDGCDFATFRNGDETFYGPGSQFTVDTTKPFTVITQFVTDDGTDNGTVNEIRRKYVQGGQTIETPSITLNGK
jgi:cellulose 1,4-beta-cellobiosidase